MIVIVEKFKAAFMAHVPDADPAKHRSVVKTSLYELTSVLVKNDDEAVEVCKELRKEGVHAFILCPGFTHKAVARIVDAVGNGISVNIARVDGPSNEVALKIMREAVGSREKPRVSGKLFIKRLHWPRVALNQTCLIHLVPIS